MVRINKAISLRKIKKFFKSCKVRMGCFLVTTLLVSHTLTAQKTTFSIYSNINYNLPTAQDLKLTYFLPYSPNRYRDGKFWHNTYERYSNGSLGFGLGANVSHKLKKDFSLIFGLAINHNTFDLYTTLSDFSVTVGSVDFDPVNSIYVENNKINWYFPKGSNGNEVNENPIDENGIPIAIPGGVNNYAQYQLTESYKMLYMAMPILLGYQINPKIDLNLGGKISFLLKSTNKTKYPYVEDRVIVNNISNSENFYLSASAAVTYNLSNRIGISLSIDKGLTNSISLNDKYAQKRNQKINTISTILMFRI